MKTDTSLITAGEDFCHASLEGQLHSGCLLQTTKEVFGITCPFRSNKKTAKQSVLIYGFCLQVPIRQQREDRK